MKYSCPNAVRKNQYAFIMCKAMMDKQTDYNITANAYRAFCAYQHQCPSTKRAENTDRARACYSYQTQKNKN